MFRVKYYNFSMIISLSLCYILSILMFTIMVYFSVYNNGAF